MSFEAGSITGKIDLDNQPAIKALRQVPNEAKDMKTKVENELKDAGKSGGEKFMHELKGSLGRRSVFGESVELLAGGGVVMGLGLAAEQIKHFADEAVKLKNEFKEGKIDAGELTEKIAEGVPIFGKFFEAGRSIRELITGERAEIEAITHEAELTKSFYDAQVASLRVHKKILRDIDAQIIKTNAERAKVGQDSFTQRAIDINQGSRENKDRLDKEIKEKVEAEQKAGDAVVKIAKERTHAANDELAKARDAFHAQQENPIGYYGAENKTAAQVTSQLKDEFTQAQAAADSMNAQLEKAQQDRASKIAGVKNRLAAAAKAEDAKTESDKAENLRALQDRKTKEITDADRAATKAMQEARIAQLRAGGQRELAEIEELRDRAQNAKNDARDAAWAKIKELGRSADPIFGATMIGKNLLEQGAIDQKMAAEIDKIKLDAQKEAADTHKEAIGRFGDETDKLRLEMEDIKKDMASGALTPLEGKGALNRLGDRVEDEIFSKGIPEPSYRSTRQETQRFQFGRLSTPDMADPLATERQRIQQMHLDEATKQTTILNDIRAAAQAIPQMGVMSAP